MYMYINECVLWLLNVCRPGASPEILSGGGDFKQLILASPLVTDAPIYCFLKAAWNIWKCKKAVRKILFRKKYIVEK